MSSGKSVKRWLGIHVLPPLGALVIRTLGRSLRLSLRGCELIDALHERGQGVIIAFWHGRQLMMPLAYRGKEAHVLISRHQDGEIIDRVVKRFGLRSVRGSTTRGGMVAIRQLIRLAKAGRDLVVTPDGPRGPCEVVQPGIIYLAKITGFPIVPLAFACSKKKSSLVGIDLSYRTPGPRPSSFGELLCGFGRKPMRMSLKNGVGNWKSFYVA